MLCAFDEFLQLAGSPRLSSASKLTLVVGGTQFFMLIGGDPVSLLPLSDGLVFASGSRPNSSSGFPVAPSRTGGQEALPEVSHFLSASLRCL